MGNKKLLILFSAVLLFVASCKKNNVTEAPGQTGITGITGSTGSTGNSTNTPYSLTETFESGAKTAYTDGNVTLSTGSWDFNNVLVGNLAGDAKDGNWSARSKGGTLSMLFDIKGITQISIKHAKYGTDAASTWQLMVSTDGGTTYTNLGSPITESTTTLVADSFKISAAKARFKIVSSGANRSNIDDINFKGTGDPGVVITVSSTPTGPDTTNTTSAAGTRGVTVGTDAPPANGDNSNLLFGNPSGAISASMAAANNYLLDQGYYVESYNNAHGTPNWVSWHLDNTNTTNAAGRGDNFAGFSFPTVSGITWNVVQSNSYNYATYGFDRGHNCPSADRTSSVNANSATFLMTNMIPQAPQNNQQTWGNLENFLRGLTTQGYEVYIVMGNYGTGGSGLNGSFNSITASGGLSINVPAHVWKVAIVLPTGNGDLARVDANTRVIAVDTPNNNSVSADWTTYITTFSSIETATGYKLFSALPQAVHDALAAKKDSGK